MNENVKVPKVGSLAYFEKRLQVAGFVIGQCYTDYRTTGRRRKLDVWKASRNNNSSWLNSFKVLDKEELKIVKDAMEGAYGLKMKLSYDKVFVQLIWVEPEFHLVKEDVESILYPGEKAKEFDDELTERLLTWLDKVNKVNRDHEEPPQLNEPTEMDERGGP